MKENKELKKSILESLDLEAAPIDVVKEMMFKNLTGISGNPILKEWYNKDVYNKLEKSFREENGIEHVDFLYYSFKDLVKKWQSEGKMRNDIDAEMIMAIFNALINVEMHKEEIGLQFFARIMDYLGEFVMKGLTDSRK